MRIRRKGEREREKREKEGGRGRNRQGDVFYREQGRSREEREGSERVKESRGRERSAQCRRAPVSALFERNPCIHVCLCRFFPVLCPFSACDRTVFLCVIVFLTPLSACLHSFIPCLRVCLSDSLCLSLFSLFLFFVLVLVLFHATPSSLPGSSLPLLILAKEHATTVLCPAKEHPLPAHSAKNNKDEAKRLDKRELRLWL